MINSPKIAVAGHLVADQIIYADGGRISAPGGIAYNLAALLSIMGSGKIIPVCEIGYDYEELFNEYFGKHDLIDSSAVRRTPLPNVVNRLSYKIDGNREEWNSRIPDRLSLKSIAADVDAVLVNFISGDDVDYEELSEFRNRSGCVIFCDYHSLALGRDDEGKRFHRKHPDGKKYLSPADMVQMNIEELGTISSDGALSFGNIITSCSAIHDLCAHTCIITLGLNGAVLSTEYGKSVYHIPPIAIRNVVDPTGCGDTFAAVFLYSYLLSGDPLNSAVIAGRYAAAKATFAGIDGFRKIDSIMESLDPGLEPVKIK